MLDSNFVHTSSVCLLMPKSLMQNSTDGYWWWLQKPAKVTVKHWALTFHSIPTHMTGDRDVFQTVGMSQELLWILVKTWRRSHREDGISSTAKKKKSLYIDNRWQAYFIVCRMLLSSSDHGCMLKKKGEKSIPLMWWCCNLTHKGEMDFQVGKYRFQMLLSVNTAKRQVWIYFYFCQDMILKKNNANVYFP